MSESSPATGVIVAGGAAGMGRATCLALAEHQRPVAVWDIKEDAAQATAAECSERYGVRTDVQVVDLADLTDESTLTNAVAASAAALGGVGALAYCAGVNGWSAGPYGVAGDEWDRVLNVNLRGPALLTRLLIPALKESGPGAAVVMCSSASIIDIGAWRDPTYIAAKTGLLGLGRALSRGLAEDGIRVNVVCPGTTDTELFREGLERNGWTVEHIAKQVPLGRIGDPMDVARAIRFLLSDEAAYITGINLVVDGGRTVGGGR